MYQYIVMVGTGYLAEYYGSFETIAKAESWANENLPDDNWRVVILNKP